MQEEGEEAPGMTRYTFVVQVHPDGPTTLENLSTHERVRVTDLTAVGPQIEQWLDGVAAAVPEAGGGEKDA
jgi:hypothetical protein